MSSTTQSKAGQLEVPPASPSLTGPRPRRSPSQRFPSTALFEGPISKTRSSVDLLSPQLDYEGDPQRLPRPQAAPSLAHIAVHRDAALRPSSRQSLANFSTPQRPKDDPFQPEALWAEMQKTLADVELSALNNSTSSQVFGSAHSAALEDLRSAQIALAKAWARSEADEFGSKKPDKDNSGTEAASSSARSSFENATIGKVDALTTSPSKPKLGVNSGSAKTGRRRRASSSASAMAADLEAETERDIQLARQRRQANDRYFEKVNKDVLNVVAKLDDVAIAMRRVESESRAIWDERSVTSTNSDINPTAGRRKTRVRAGTRDTQETTDSEMIDDDLTSLEHVLTRSTLNDTGIKVSSDNPEAQKRDNAR